MCMRESICFQCCELLPHSILSPKVEATETYTTHFFLKFYTELLVFLSFCYITEGTGSDLERKPYDTTGHLEQGALDCVCGSVHDGGCGNHEVQSWIHTSAEKSIGSGILVGLLSTPGIIHCPLPPAIPFAHKAAQGGI